MKMDFFSAPDRRQMYVTALSGNVLPIGTSGNLPRTSCKAQVNCRLKFKSLTI